MRYEDMDFRWLDIYIQKLPVARQRIVIRRCFLGNDKLTYLAKQFNVSPQRVHEIQRQALHNLFRLLPQGLYRHYKTTALLSADADIPINP